MKKIITLLAVMTLALAQTAISQDINLKFTGATTGGAYVRLDSVLVQSISSSWSEMLVYPDTVLSFTQTGIAETQGLAAELSAYPNPFNGATNVSVTLPRSSKAVLQVFNLAGQEVAERSLELQAGNNIFEVRLQHAQVYLLAVTTPQGRSTIKLINRRASSENRISLRGNVVEKRQSSQQFQSGDELVMVGYASRNGNVYLSNIVQQTQTASENFTLFFNMSSPSVLSGIFSIGAHKHVLFSGGNLQYTNLGTHATADSITPGTWRFAPNQWDTICASNRNISDSYTGWIDLFGWGTSGFHHPDDQYNVYYYPYSHTVGWCNIYNVYGYGPSINMSDRDLTGTCANYDWGVYNAISNGGNRPGIWRTLTKDEWTYLIHNRTTASGVRFAKATVNGVAGLIIVPDDWDTTICPLINRNTYDDSFANNVLTSSQWSNMESAGCAFLPFAGFRMDLSVNMTSAEYWTASSFDSISAYRLSFDDFSAYVAHYYRHMGRSVRLVRDTVVPMLPTVNTSTISTVTDTTAMCLGTATAGSSTPITARGVCWDTSHNPTIANAHTTSGAGSGSFTCSLTGLTPGTTYYVRAYATNVVGTAYGNELSFTTNAYLPSVTTTAASSITSSSATSGGNVVSSGSFAVTARGVCWSTSQTPTISGNHTTDGSGTGSFTSSITGLTAGTTYYVRAYATNAVGTAYGSQITFTTTALPPTVTTTAASNITSTTATSGGNVTSAGSSAVTARGVCWSTSQNPTVRGNHTTNGSGTGSFTSSITGLTPATTYYVRAYAISSVDTVYGSQITFTTSAVAPTVTTTAASNITSTTATSGGNVTSAGSSAVTARGVCWSTSQNPTVRGNHTTDGSGTGSFTSNITGLTAGTTYYVRAYAISAVDTAYGSQITFTTSAVAPTVTTTAASNITSTTATSGGNVTSTGGAAVTARGVCWSTSQNPTISGNHTTDGSGTGSFTSSITGLTPGTTYYVRAYATNTAGTAYGSQITFTTALPNNVFSTAAGTYVYFSPGNLQWSAKNGGTTAVTHAVAGGGTAAGAWRFAAHQWDTIGRANSNVSSSYSGWIDMFGWGTSGYNSKYPYMTSTTATDYGNGSNNITGTNYDWGVYNAIYNPKTSTTDAPGTWRTLSNNEWVYLIRTRTTPSGIRYAKATVNGVPGVILVPDNWSTSTYTFNSTNTSSAAFTTNVINASTWNTLENAGCIFLPAAGCRSGTTIQDVGVDAMYWSTTYYNSSQSYYLRFYSSLVTTDYVGRHYGSSVRLVKNYNNGQAVQFPTVTTTAASNITSSTATGGGNVTSAGSSSVTARGVCWSTSQNPTISDNHTTNSSGTGSFTSNLTGLAAGTTYYVRAYATNSAGTAYGNQISFTTTAPANAFSVAAGSYVYFAPGNLQWSAKNGGSTATTHTVAGGGTAAGTWRFASHQWDTIGRNNIYMSSSYSGWMDLFGWATSGYNSKYPYMNSTTATDYGNGANDIAGTNYDWGVYNAIYNPKTSTTDAPGTWRTLTEDEWDYLLRTRNTASGIRYAKAVVNGIQGIIIVPDIWSTSIYALDSTNTNNSTYTSNVINLATWNTMENAGCVFLPITGIRWRNDVHDGLYYWSSSMCIDAQHAYEVVFNYGYRFNPNQQQRYFGLAVRLARDVH